MFTWAQPGSGMFKLISAYNSAVKRNPNKQELSANPENQLLFSFSYPALVRGKKIIPEVQFERGCGEQSSGATTGEGFLFFLPPFF